ncbi:hypothetical protein NP245_24085, partial [Salmonella enterica]|nr:hypothetical protein [Salmonella enterica]
VHVKIYYDFIFIFIMYCICVWFCRGNVKTFAYLWRGGVDGAVVGALPVEGHVAGRGRGTQ